MGSFKSSLCDQEVGRMWSSYSCSYSVHGEAHIPGILNVEADQESRQLELRTEWKLNESIFGYIKKYLDFYPSADLFASRINAQLHRFFAYRPDPKAEVINGFCVP